MLKKTDFDLRELDGIEVSAAPLRRPGQHQQPRPHDLPERLLTIKAYDERFQIYTLGFPNDEVKYGFLNSSPLSTPPWPKPRQVST